MTWNLGTIKSRALSRAALASTNTQVTSAVLTDMVNEALMQVCLEADWPWLRQSETLTTSAGVSNETLNGLWMRTESLVDATTGQPLTRRKAPHLDQIVWQGRPYVYAVEGNKLTVKPIPDGPYTLTHRYMQYEPPLAADNDVPLMPELYGRGVVLFTANLAAIKAQQPATAASIAADYQSWLKRAKDNINQGREPLRVEVRPGGWL